MNPTSMAETGSETDIKPVKEALQAQQKLLQKLYAELEKEREASATAASEALSMILRLQGEKAAVKMEASQYQRIAEEKIYHAEESLVSFEDIIYQKEMEIASLEFQVQAYKYKLISSGVSDFPSDCRFTENGEMGFNGKVRRMKSLPPIPLEEQILKKLEYPKNHFSFREQVEMLNEQVKEISTSKECEEEVAANLSIQDIFEIPEANKNLKASETMKPLQKKLSFEDDSREIKPDSVSTEPSESQVEDEALKAKKASNCKSIKNKSSKSRKGKGLDSQNFDEIVVESLPFQQLCHRIERLEFERNGERREISDAREEEVRMLKEIQEQLNSIQSEMRSLKGKKPSPPDKSMDVLREAMLYFWI